MDTQGQEIEFTDNGNEQPTPEDSKCRESAS